MRKKVSVKIAVDEALDAMGMQETRDYPVFTRWAINADRKIGTPNSYHHCIKVLDVVGCSAELPIETIAVDHVAYGNYGLNCFNIFPSTVPQLTIRFQSGDGLLVIDTGSTGSYDRSLPWAVIDNKIQLCPQYNGSQITVRLKTYFLDPEGFPMIDEEHAEAIAQYIMFRYAVRSRFKKKDKMTEFDVKDLEEEWHRLCRHARAESGKLEGSKDSYINDVNNPISGQGINLPFNNNINNSWI